MKNFYKYIISTLVVILISAIIFSILYSRAIDTAFLNSDSSIVKYKKLPKYHIYVILHNSDEPYLKDEIKGLKETADVYKIALEINYTNNVDDYQDTLRLLNIAIASKVDGIITHSYNTPEFISLIEEADKRKIPVVTLDTGIPESKNASFVGTNGFEVGSMVGKLVAEATKGSAKVAVILEDVQNYGNIKLEGFKDSVKNYKDISIETVKVSDLGILGANNATQEILMNYPDVNAIVCTSSKDTIGTAQLVVDFNKVGDIAIVGYDITPEIMEYIEKGVIYGTVIPNAYTIGSKSIKQLMDIKENGRTSSYYDTDLSVITKTNLDEYIKNSKIPERGKSNK
jgi:ribose transport system substrate-binding protein